MRLFLATRLSAANRRDLEAVMGEVVRSSGGLLRPVPRGSEHLTHVFLGEREESVEALLSALAPLADLRSFAIRFEGTEVFGRGRPRLVCSGVGEGAGRIRDLGEAMLRCLVPLAPDLADYRLKPAHATLARFKRGARRPEGRAVAELLESSGAARWEAEDRVERVELIRSNLSHRGPGYETVGEIVLG